MKYLHERKIWVLFFLFVLSPVSAHEITVAVRPEYNRTFQYCQDFEFAAAFPIDVIHTTIKSGLSLGFLGGNQRDTVYNMKAFFSGEYELPVFRVLHFGVVYIFNELPDYGTHTLAVLPTIAFKWKWAGFAVGITNRWTTFFNESSIYEPILSLSAYVNFWTSEKFRIGMRIANYSDFAAANMGDYSLNVNSVVRVSERFSVINEVEVYQAGSVGLTSNFYGIAYRGGAVYKW